MWSVGSNTADLYLGSRLVVLRVPPLPVATEVVKSADQAFEVATRWMTAIQPRLRFNVWLSGGFCRPILVETLPGVRGVDEIHKSIQALAPQRTGLAGPCQVWVERRGAQQSCMAAAVSSSQLDRIIDVVRGSGHRIRSIRPWWSAAMRGVLACEGAPAHMLGVQDCDSVTVLIGSDIDFEFASTVTPLLEPGSALAVVRRAAMSSRANPEHGTLVRLAPGGGRTDSRRVDVALGCSMESI